MLNAWLNVLENIHVWGHFQVLKKPDIPYQNCSCRAFDQNKVHVFSDIFIARHKNKVW